MSLIVEDGTAPAGADTYASLATINAYALSRGLTFAITGADTTPAEQAARRAFVFINTRYRSRFTGIRTYRRLQSGEFPRYNCYDAQDPPSYLHFNEIPQEIIDAQCEAAIREKATPGYLNPDVTPGKIKKSFSAGGVAVVYEVGSSGAGGQRPDMAVIDEILSSLIGRSSGYSGKSLRG